MFVKNNEIRKNFVVYLSYKTANLKNTHTWWYIMNNRIWNKNMYIICQSRQGTLLCGINKLQNLSSFNKIANAYFLLLVFTNAG